MKILKIFNNNAIVIKDENGYLEDDYSIDYLLSMQVFIKLVLRREAIAPLTYYVNGAMASFWGSVSIAIAHPNIL